MESLQSIIGAKKQEVTWSKWPIDKWRKWVSEYDIKTEFKKWNQKHGYMDRMPGGEMIPTKIPYKHSEDGMLLVADDFVEMIEKIKQPSLLDVE